MGMENIMDSASSTALETKKFLLDSDEVLSYGVWKKIKHTEFQTEKCAWPNDQSTYFRRYF